ncbi:MAG: tetratricopeptide repeat protein [Vicinamibacterales bacterium]
MTMRCQTVAVAALVIGTAVGTAGCGRYSLNALKAQKAYKEANELYKASDWKAAATKYEYVLKQDRDRSEVYFYLANSYDNAYKPARAGEAQNDSYIQKAIENYKKSASEDKNPDMKKLALQYLVAAYGPEKLNDPSQAEPIIQQLVQIDPNEPNTYFALSKLYEDSGRYDEAEQALLKGRDVKPNDPAVYATISGFYNRQGNFEKTMEALNKAAELDSNNPQAHHLLAPYYQEAVTKDHRLTDVQKRDYIEKGLAAEERALAINPDYVDALVYKNILLRLKGNIEKDLGKRQELFTQADTIRNRAMELQKKKTAGTN